MASQNKDQETRLAVSPEADREAGSVDAVAFQGVQLAC